MANNTTKLYCKLLILTMISIVGVVEVVVISAENKGELYGVIEDLYEFNTLQLINIDYNTGDIKVIINCTTNVAQSASFTYYATAIDLKHQRIYYNNMLGDEDQRIIYFDLIDRNCGFIASPINDNDSTTMRSYPLVAEYPASDRVFVMVPQQLVYELNTANNTFIESSVAPYGNMLGSELFLVIPSYNPQINSITYTSYYKDILFPKLYFLNIQTNQTTESTSCFGKLESLRISIFYDPISMQYYTLTSVIVNTNNHTLSSGEVVVYTVDIDTCEFTSVLTITGTRRYPDWYQLYTFDPYSGYLFLMMSNELSEMWTIDVRNRAIVSQVRIPNLPFYAPLQFSPFEFSTSS